MDIYEILAKNIKYYRKKNNESQETLAKQIDHTRSMIGYFENNKRKPDIATIHKIAHHYRITVDELISLKSSYSYSKVCSKIQMKDYIKDMATLLFPAIKTDQALKNQYFKTGYDMHNKIMKGLSLLNAGYFTQQDYELCIESYNKSADENIPEAIANLISISIIECLGNLPHLCETVYDLKRLSLQEALKKSSIVDLEKENINRYITSEDEKEISSLLKELYKYPKYRDLVSYYSAIRYFFGIVNNSNSVEMNRAIGSEMMTINLKLGNKYLKQANDYTIK